VYDRAKLKAGNRVPGPAIVMEMDSTTVILPRHHGIVDKAGNILIYPDGYKEKGAVGAATRPKPKASPKAAAKTKATPKSKPALKAKARSKGRK